MAKLIKNTVSVDENNFEYAIKGSSSPSVIFINGAGGIMEGWSKIWGKWELENVLFSYNRLGIGKSTKPLENQTGNIMARDLKDLLFSVKVEPPYILIGHSLGGLIAQLFAMTYPNEVIGIIFLESSTIKDVLTTSSTKKIKSPNQYSEVNQVLTTIQQIKEIGVFPNIPIVVIAGNKPAFRWIIPRKVKEERMNNQKELSSLSDLGRVVVAHNSGHFPQLSQPKLVINEIRGLIEKLSDE